MHANTSAPRARWRVAWIAKGKVVGKSFGEDFGGALELHSKAQAAGRRGATLICANVAFNPPDRLRPRTVRKIKREIVKRRGKKYVKNDVIVGQVYPLRKLNLKGIWWCPYCVKLRKFERRDGFNSEGQWVPDPGYYCPICGISHRDFGVRKHNPVAQRIYSEPGKRLLNLDGTRKKRRRR